jgi:hydroxyethylthiazole kinase-like uncharacterized protein yjeF
MNIEFKNALYNTEQVRKLDQMAIVDLGIPAKILMKRAGQTAFAHLRKNWPGVKHIQVICGSGNNGGDGYVVAALGAQQGLNVQVWHVGKPSSEAAQAAYNFARQECVDIQDCTPEALRQGLADVHMSTVIVDALLGTGCRGQLRAPYKAIINTINESLWPVLALDVPSGVSADSGTVAETAVVADTTVSFIAQKLGNLVGSGRLCSGRRYLCNLDLPDDFYQKSGVNPSAQRLDRNRFLRYLPARIANAHKGDFGHLLIIGGDFGFGGAPLMAAQMALRAGAGLVSIATRSINTPAIVARQPEIMAKGVDCFREVLPLLEKATVLAIGPGLGQSSWSKQLLYHCLNINKTTVLDADALNLIARGQVKLPKKHQLIITPHPGEAATLLGKSVRCIEENRIEAVRDLQSRFGATTVLKGSGTLVATSDGEIFVCDAGNPGMASGGMGDVLTGLIAALVAQGLSPDQAACLGVVAHAEAADQVVAKTTAPGLLATDLVNPVRALLHRHP